MRLRSATRRSRRSAVSACGRATPTTVPSASRHRSRDSGRGFVVQESARRLAQFLESAVELMVVLARACGHDRLDQFSVDDLTTFDREMAHLSGVAYGGVSLT